MGASGLPREEGRDREGGKVPGGDMPEPGDVLPDRGDQDPPSHRHSPPEALVQRQPCEISPRALSASPQDHPFLLRSQMPRL